MASPAWKAGNFKLRKQTENSETLFERIVLVYKGYLWASWTASCHLETDKISTLLQVFKLSCAQQRKLTYLAAAWAALLWLSAPLSEPECVSDCAWIRLTSPMPYMLACHMREMREQARGSRSSSVLAIFVARFTDRPVLLWWSKGPHVGRARCQGDQLATCEEDCAR